MISQKTVKMNNTIKLKKVLIAFACVGCFPLVYVIGKLFIDLIS